MVNKYYDYQSVARGVDSEGAVTQVISENEHMYNALLTGWLPKDQSTEIHEVGCGPGIFLKWLSLKGYTNISGSDFSARQVEIAKSVGLNVTQIDANSSLGGYKDGSLACLVALDFYEHLTKEDLVIFLEEANRVLMVGGKLILKGPNGESPVVGRSLFNDITHYWALTPVAFEAVLRMTGFSMVVFSDTTLISFNRFRWFRVPLALLAQFFLRSIIRLATREHIKYLSSSIFLCATK